jgi:uncharacterized iron-regulated membrane protein
MLLLLFAVAVLLLLFGVVAVVCVGRWWWMQRPLVRSTENRRQDTHQNGLWAKLCSALAHSAPLSLFPNTHAAYLINID